MTAFWGEVIGTMILIVFGAGVCAGVNLKGTFAENSGWIVITMGWGMGVAMGAYAVGEISGAHLNPALTVGLAIAGDFSWGLVPMYILAQMIGAFIGAALIYLHYLPHWEKTKDPGTKLGVFSTGPAIPNLFANLLSEVLGTFILVLGIMAIGANQFTEGLNPLIVGFLILAIGLSLGGTTGYAINPARDLGPRIAHAVLPIFGKGPSNWSYAWIPVAGPIAGGALGAVFYNFAFKGIINSAFWVVTALVILLLGGAYAYSKRTDSSVRQPV
ncbi:MIP/aquaporin family protein [Metabacillus sp. 84]|uniref:MIP/aquaporin family protein n=1 Tax=Metabacillus sp. 84 TaxID=3404705 RepID=UPI003CEA191D